MEPNIEHQYLVEEHKRKVDQINRNAWKFKIQSPKKQYNIHKQFCFSLGKKWCITIRSI